MDDVEERRSWGQRLAMATVVLMAVASLAFGYWFGEDGHASFSETEKGRVEMSME